MELARESLSALADKLDLSPEWQDIALDVVNEFLRKKEDLNEDIIENIVKWSALIATKSLNNESLNKNSKHGSAIAVTLFFKDIDSEQVNNLLYLLKEIINEISLDPDISQSWKEFISRFGFINSFFDKYSRIWDSLEFKCISDSCGHSDSSPNETLESIRKLGWMIFVLAKFNLLRNKIQIVDWAWMLMATFYILITNLDTSETTCKVLEECMKGKLDEVETNQKIFESLFKLMVKDHQGGNDEDTEPVKISISILLNMLCKLKDNKILGASNKHDKNIDVDEEMEDEESKQINGSNSLGLRNINNNYSSNSDTIKGIFDKNNVNANYTRIWCEYEKELKSDDLDERFFLDNNIKTNSINVTPFTRQGYANKLANQKYIKKEAGISQVGTSQFSSKRLLDYNANSTNQAKMLTLSSQLKDIKFPSMVQCSPYSIRAFTPATPVSLALEMVNWMKLRCETVKKSLDSDGFPPVMSRHLTYWKEETKIRIIQNLESWVAKIDYECKNDYNHSVSGNTPKESLKYLYLKFVDELLSQEESNTLSRRKLAKSESVAKELSKTLYRIEFHKAVFTWAAETILFIYNEQKLIFEQLLEFMNLSVFDFWKIVNSFIVVDSQMPTPLKRHFRDIEIKIVTDLGWKDNTTILEYQSELNDIREDVEMQAQTPPDENIKTSSKSKEVGPGSGESPMTEEDIPSKFDEDKVSHKTKRAAIKPLDLFFRRVLHLSAYKILTLSEELGLNDAIKEQAWEVIKKCLGYETHLLYNRHLDQLILCTIYGVCKINFKRKEEQKKFNAIIKTYKELQSKLTGASVQMFQNMYTTVRLVDDSYGNIIDFYNKIFINTMKPYIMNLDPRNEQLLAVSPKPKIWALAPQSPLRQNLPPACLTYSTIYSSKGIGGTPSRYGIVTPGMRRMPMLAMTPRTKTLYNFGESQTKDLDKANTEIRKSSQLFKQASAQINFGSGTSIGIYLSLITL